MFCVFSVDELIDFGFGVIEIIGCGEIVVVDNDDFVFGFGRVDFFLIRIDVGIYVYIRENIVNVYNYLKIVVLFLI